MACPERVALVIEYVELLKAAGSKVGGIGYLVADVGLEGPDDGRAPGGGAEVKRPPPKPGAGPAGDPLELALFSISNRWAASPVEKDDGTWTLKEGPG